MAPNHSPLPPPTDLIRRKETTVIVSTNKPIIVYFNRAVKLLEKQILLGQSGSPVGIDIVACGGAIPRCQQLARYVTQSLSDKYLHLVLNVVKTASRNVASVSVTDSLYSETKFQEENAFDVVTSQRQVDQMIITISAQRL